MRKALLLMALALLWGGSARAHEILTGVGSQAMFKVHRTEILVDFNMQYAHFAAFQHLIRGDMNGDKSLSEEERSALTDSILARILDETDLFLDGKKVEPVSTELTDDRAILMGRIEPLPFEAWWTIRYEIPPLVPGKMHSLIFLDNTYAGEVAQQDLWVMVQDIHVDNLLIVDPEPTFEYESYRVRGHRRVEMQIGVLEGAGPPDEEGVVPTGTSDRPPVEKSEAQEEMETIQALFHRAREGVVGLVIALVLAAFWGAVHALGPGHGKTMVAAYLVGSKGRVRDAVILGGVATFAHTFSLFIIGLLLIWVFMETMDRSRAAFEAWLSVASGLFVVALGIMLFIQRLRAWRNPEIDEAHRKAHELGVPHGHSHGHHHHHHHHHDHHHPKKDRMHLASLISLGFTGGMIPCPMGLVLVITAFHYKAPILGVALLATFSAGLGIVLIAVGVTLVLTKSTLAARTGISEDSKFIKVLPVISAILVTLVGVWLTYTSGVDGYDKGVLRPFVDGVLSFFG